MIPGRDDAENFRKLTTAMDVLDFSREEQDTIHKILASVLHIGNVYFKTVQVRDCRQVQLLGHKGDDNIFSVVVEATLRQTSFAATKKIYLSK